MINKEQNCKWHFDPQAKGNEKGPNNPTALTFKGTKYHSLIKENHTKLSRRCGGQNTTRHRIL